MGYAIQECTGESGQIEEVSGFLAGFVADGEGGKSDALGISPATWVKRLGWWWEANPYCGPESPRGLILRRGEGEVVGFTGFIPHDYVLDGERVPSLIATTTFVRRECREAAAGLFLRSHRLREKYHLVDGGPNEEMAVLLGRVGYQRAEGGRMLVYPVRRRGLRARALLMQFGRLVTPRPNGRLETGVGVGEIGEVTSVPPVVDSRLRKHVDKATLEWYLGTGSRQKYFYGWCDDGGLLRSYVIGVPRRKYGLEGMVVMDFGAFGEGGEEVLNEVVAEIADRPAACGLPAEVEVLLWPIPGGYRGRVSPISRRYDAKLYYRMPARIDGAERVCLPMEGDKILL